MTTDTTAVTVTRFADDGNHGHWTTQVTDRKLWAMEALLEGLPGTDGPSVISVCYMSDDGVAREWMLAAPGGMELFKLLELSIQTKSDADFIREDIAEIHDGWYSTGRVDWEDFLDRLEALGYDLGQDMLSPAIKRIKKIVTELRKEAGEA